MTRSIREGDRSVFTLSTSSFLLVSPHSKRCTETNSEAPLSRTLCLKRCKTTSKSVTTNRTSPFLSLIFSTTLSTRSSVPAPVPAPSSTTRVVLPAAAEAAEAPKNCSIFSSRFKYAARSNEASHMVNPVSGTGSRSSFLRVFSSSSSSPTPSSSFIFNRFLSSLELEHWEIRAWMPPLFFVSFSFSSSFTSSKGGGEYVSSYFSLYERNERRHDISSYNARRYSF